MLANLPHQPALSRRAWALLAALVAAGTTQPILAAEPCREQFSQDAVQGGRDLQPTEAEIADRLEAAGCADGAADTSNADGKAVDQIYNELMKQSDKDLGTTPKP